MRSPNTIPLAMRPDTSHNQMDSNRCPRGSFTSTPKNTIVNHGKRAARGRLRYSRRSIESLFEKFFEKHQLSRIWLLLQKLDRNVPSNHTSTETHSPAQPSHLYPSESCVTLSRSSQLWGLRHDVCPYIPHPSCPLLSQHYPFYPLLPTPLFLLHRLYRS